MAKPITSNPDNFLKATIKRFKQAQVKSGNEYRADWQVENFYTGGHCAEFAYALAEFANNMGIPASIEIMYRENIETSTDKVVERVFSHAIVKVKESTFDIINDDARSRWFVRQPIDMPMPGEDMDFEERWNIVEIPFDNKEQAFCKLERHCLRQGVDFSIKQIADDAEMLSSLIAKSSDNEFVA